MLIVISAVVVSIVSVIILVYAFKEKEPKTAAKSRPPLPSSNQSYNISREDVKSAVAEQTLVSPLRSQSLNKSQQQSSNNVEIPSDSIGVVTVFEPLFDVADISRSHSGFDSFGDFGSSHSSHASSDHSSCDSSSSDCGSSD
jgi:hypothetical protein